MGFAGWEGGLGRGPASLLKGVLDVAFSKHGSGFGGYP